MATEPLQMPETVTLTLPEELTSLAWVEIHDVQTIEHMVAGAAGHRVLAPGEAPADDERIVAERTRFALGGVALGSHPELGAVTLEAGQEPRTTIAYTIVFTPWKDTATAAAERHYFEGGAL